MFLFLQTYEKLEGELDFKPHKFGPNIAVLDIGLQELQYINDIEIIIRKFFSGFTKEAFLVSQNSPN